MKDKIYNLFKVIGEYALYGILFFLAISNALVEIFVLLAFLSFIVRKIIKPDFKFLKAWPNSFLLLFLLFSALSLFNSGAYFNKSLHALFGKWMQYLGICIIIQDGIYDKKIVKRAIAIFLFGAFLAVLSGLSQYFLGIEFLRGNNISLTNEGMRAITSSFAHYNGFGAYLVVVLAFLFALLLFPKVSKIKTCTILTFNVLTIVAILLTFSRGSWMALVVSFILLAALSGRNVKWIIPLFLVTVAMFSLPAFHERLILTFREGGDSDRFRYWLAAWKMINEHPFFGMGVGTFMANFHKFLPNSIVAYAHNCYLQIWAETGIFALFSFGAFVGSLFYFGIRRFIASQDLVLLGLLSGAAGFLAHSFFETNLYSLRLAILFWVWAGLILGRISQKQEE